MTVGVLALQGAFGAHVDALTTIGVDAREVRQPAHLEGVSALVIPGGESTTISMMLERTGLLDPVRTLIDDGAPALGTCAGMILLATAVADGRVDQHYFAAIDIDVSRNGYGRQVDSFEADLKVNGVDEPVHGVFIRAPVVDRVGADVEVLARHEDRPVMCRSGKVMVTSFHPELSGSTAIHELFVDNF